MKFDASVILSFSLSANIAYNASFYKDINRRFIHSNRGEHLINTSHYAR